MTNYKRLYKVIKETDEIFDLNPDLKKATSKILEELIKKLEAKGGAIVAYDFLDDCLKTIAKKGPLSHKIIKESFEKGKKQEEKRKVSIPIILDKKPLGVIYIFGKEFTNED